MPTLTATKSGPTSNCYATLDEADGYLDNVYGADEWGEINDDDKERLLITATKQIEKLTAIYSKVEDGQALKFPVNNTNDLDKDGWEEIKEACIIQAWYLYQNNDAIKEAITANISGQKGESLGKVSKTMNGFNLNSQYGPQVLSLLKSYIAIGFRTCRA